MFVLLTVLAFALYAPAVLLPILREHANLLAEERELREDVRELTADLERRKRLTDDFQTDPMVNERLAQLDLRYQRPGEEIVEIPSEHLPPPIDEKRAGPRVRPEELVPPEWPVWAHDAERFARRKGLTQLYLDPAIRVVLLLMAGGLMIAAFVLYAPQVRRREPEDAAATGR